MKGPIGPPNSADSVSAVDRAVGYARLARRYQMRRIWAAGLWSSAVFFLSPDLIPSLSPWVAAVGVVPFVHGLLRLRQPGLTATGSVAVDFVAASGVVVLLAPPTGVFIAIYAYLIPPLLLFLSLRRAGTLLLMFATLGTLVRVLPVSWASSWPDTEALALTATAMAAALPMGVWGYRRIAEHLHTSSRLHADLARRDQEFQDLWEGAAVALYRIDMDGHFLRINQRMTELIGADCPYAHLNELRMGDLWNDSGAYDEWVATLRREGTVVNEWEMPRPDGGRITVRGTARLVTDMAGAPRYLEGSLEDITDRIETTRQLRFHASVLEHVRSAILATDTDGIVTYWNRHAERLHGWSAEEVMGKPVFDFIVPADPEVMREILSNLRENGYWEGEAEMRRADGQVVPTRTVTGTLRDTDGRAVGSVGVSADISDLKEVNRRLEHLLEFKDQFISAVSHELRTPLAGLVGFVELLRSSQEGREEYLEMVSDQAHELARIVEDLLVAGRIDQDDLTILPEAVHVGQVAENMLSSLKETGSLTLGDLDVWAVADPLRLGQILRNLIANALQYGEPPQRIEAERRGEMVEIRVIDHGPGIPEHLRDDIFHPYQQARIDRARPGHLGLGLHIARTLSELMNGELAYDSSDGSCFSLRLPAASRPDAVEPHAAKQIAAAIRN